MTVAGVDTGKFAFIYFLVCGFGSAIFQTANALMLGKLSVVNWKKNRLAVYSLRDNYLPKNLLNGGTRQLK